MSLARDFASLIPEKLVPVSRVTGAVGVRIANSPAPSAATSAQIGDIVFTPIFVPKTTTITGIEIRTSGSAPPTGWPLTSSLSYKVGIYDSLGTDSLPNNLVFTADGVISTAVSTNSFVQIWSGSQTLPRGLYWMAFVGTSGGSGTSYELASSSNSGFTALLAWQAIGTGASSTAAPFGLILQASVLPASLSSYPVNLASGLVSSPTEIRTRVLPFYTLFSY